jgi:hypothetical protein
MTTYQVSTPRFTCLVEVDEAGLIIHTAPYLRRTWQGKAWATLTAQMQRQYGAEVRIHQLVPMGRGG